MIPLDEVALERLNQLKHAHRMLSYNQVLSVPPSLEEVSALAEQVLSLRLEILLLRKDA